MCVVHPGGGGCVFVVSGVGFNVRSCECIATLGSCEVISGVGFMGSCEVRGFNVRSSHPGHVRGHGNGVSGGGHVCVVFVVSGVRCGVVRWLPETEVMYSDL